MNPFELIIFDCDGVLVDSERIANEAFAKLLNQRFGFSLSLDDMFKTFVGHSSSQCIALIAEMLGKEPPADLEESYQSVINQALFSSVTRVPGIRRAIAELDVPYCVASGGAHEKMQITLGKTGLLSLFEDDIYSTSDVGREKPSPDIYLYAAHKMGGIKPSKCLVIEDSPLGVEGGRRAGMTVFGYKELMSEKALIAAGAHHTFDKMWELMSEIEAYTGRSEYYRENF